MTKNINEIIQHLPAKRRQKIEQRSQELIKEVHNTMPVKNHQDDLLKRLSDPNYASQYLKVALDETLKDGNKEAFFLALKNIMDAKQKFKTLPKTTEKSQKKIEQLLCKKEQLTIENLLFILQSVGISIDFKPIMD